MNKLFLKKIHYTGAETVFLVQNNRLVNNQQNIFCEMCCVI